MSAFRFSELSPYVYYDIIKYMQINDQIEHQRVNKTWRDSTKVVLREYRTLIIGKHHPISGIMTDWFPKGPKLCIEGSESIDRLMNWDIANNLSGLNTVVFGYFNELEVELDLKNLPTSIEHVHLDHCGVQLVTSMIEELTFTMLRCLTISSDATIDIETDLFKLIEMNRGMDKFAMSSCPPEALAKLLDSFEYLEQFRLDDCDGDIGEDLISNIVEKLYDCTHVRIPCIGVDDLLSLYYLRTIESCQWSAPLDIIELNQLLCKFGHQLETLSVVKVEGFDDWQYLKPCANNLKYLSIGTCDLTWFASIDYDFRKLRTFVIESITGVDLAKLETVINIILSKCPKLRLLSVRAYLPQTDNQLQVNRVIQPVEHYAFEHPKRKISFVFNKLTTADCVTDVPNLRIIKKWTY